MFHCSHPNLYKVPVVPSYHHAYVLIELLSDLGAGPGASRGLPTRTRTYRAAGPARRRAAGAERQLTCSAHPGCLRLGATRAPRYWGTARAADAPEARCGCESLPARPVDQEPLRGTRGTWTAALEHGELILGLGHAVVEACPHRRHGGLPPRLWLGREPPGELHPTQVGGY